MYIISNRNMQPARRSSAGNRPDIGHGVVLWVVGRSIGPGPTVIVGVEVEHNELGMTLPKPGKNAVHLRVEVVVLLE